MSDHQDKTEQATPYKLEEARKKGQVPHSQEWISLIVVVVFFIALFAIIKHVASTIAQYTQWWLGNAHFLAKNEGVFISESYLLFNHIFSTFIPLVFAMVVAAIIANITFKGLIFSFFGLKIDFQRLNPVKGLKKIFSKKLLFELAKTIFKIILFSIALYYFFKKYHTDITLLWQLSVLQIPSTFSRLMLILSCYLLLVMLLSTLLDMWYSRNDFAKQMKMSKHEVKEEYRRREGDPTIRAKRKQIQSDLLKKISSLSSIKDADVIITNPTHIAIALQYRPKTMLAPVVVTMGKGQFAKQICRVARQHNVPIIRKPPVARALLAQCKIDSQIPDNLQLDVAQVYKWVISLPNHKVSGL